MDFPKVGRKFKKNFTCRRYDKDGARNARDTASISIKNNGEEIEIEAESSEYRTSNLYVSKESCQEVSFCLRREDFEDFVRLIREFYEKENVDVLETTYSPVGDSKFENRTNILHNLDKIEISLGARITISAIASNKTGMVSIPLYKRKTKSGPYQNPLLEDLVHFLNQLEIYESGESEIGLNQIIDDDTREKLRSTNYGEEVISHLEDGDKCLSQGMKHPALNSYIHAIEWSLISLLDNHANIDILEREKNGEYYYFAGGGNSLLDEVVIEVGIDQTTEERVRSINRAERRWSSHHKSGNVDVEALKSLRKTIQSLALKHE